MKTTRRPVLSASQNAYAIAKALADQAEAEYMAAGDDSAEEASAEEVALYKTWREAFAVLRAAEKVMVAEMTAKLKADTAAKGHAATIDYVVENATGKDWSRVVDLCFRAA